MSTTVAIVRKIQAGYYPCCVLPLVFTRPILIPLYVITEIKPVVWVILDCGTSMATIIDAGPVTEWFSSIINAGVGACKIALSDLTQSPRCTCTPSAINNGGAQCVVDWNVGEVKVYLRDAAGSARAGRLHLFCLATL